MARELDQDALDTVIERLAEVMKTQDSIRMNDEQPPDVSRALKRRSDRQLQTRQAKRFRVADDEGRSWIHTFPRLAHGYLAVGNAQFELGHYARAVATYQRGMEAVKDPDLERALQRAIACRDIRLDPLSKLDGTLLQRIFNVIPEQRLTCIGLSQRWRESLLNLPVWNSLDIFLRDFSSPLWQDGLTRVLNCDLKCVSIQDIVGDKEGRFLGISVQEESFQLCINARLCKRIQTLASRSLADIRISLTLIPSNFTRFLLFLCPKLTVLSCTFLPGYTLSILPPLQVPPAFNAMTAPFTHAHLKVLQTPYSTEGLDDISAVVPSLQALLVCGEWKPESPMNAALRHLSPKSELRLLHLSDQGKEGDDLDAALSRLQGETGNGLHDFHLSVMPPNETMHDALNRVMQANRDTLVHVRCPRRMMVDAIGTSRSGHQTKFPNVCRLDMW
ncbi:hypothetical protein BCR43DRAFT_507953 [Syncephalastrum racemosum]|uniref:F-box domain-containing protein n=1 Tax=Syncephalastrum racemosum TaxID=13706 RepID=A0A1X2H5D0_SYNRA|nr:hypothetical protein BCR43DRAFT_507953 [Syncephalastrum racemosum]